MEMDEEFLEVNDLDWFASCQSGLLAHFATGGRGFVPVAVRKSISVYEEVYDYFQFIEASTDVEVVEGNLPEFSSEVQRERYLRSFVEMAKRGLFSYDSSGDGGYKLIVKPKRNRGCFDLLVGIKSALHVLPVKDFDNVVFDDFL